MEAQRKNLVQTLAVVVKSLDKLDAHRSCGRRRSAVATPATASGRTTTTVGAALLWTFEQGLGPDFDDATRDAWAEAYGLLASVMIDASEAVAA